LGSSGDDVIYGNGGNDVVDGGSDNDKVDGGAGNDSVIGNDGDDTLFGGNGDDLVSGGQGDDKLRGGSGADTFYFVAGEDSTNHDIVVDFEDDIDRMAIEQTLIGDYSQSALEDYAAQVGNNVVFTFSTGDTLTVRNILVDDLIDDCAYF
jgi:Ca2+-binding RTX toxin-like protein